MSDRRTNPARIVFDPAIPPWQLRLLRAGDRARTTVTAPTRHLRHAADRAVVVYFLAAAGAVAVQAAVPGAPWAWAWFLAVTTLLGSVMAAAVRCAALRYRGRYVNPARMDPASRQLLARAQAAISDVIATRICREGYMDALGAAAVLGAREWEVARMLGTACELAAALDGIPSAPAHQAALRLVRAAALCRTEALEDCARQVGAADAAYRARAAAGPLASLDGSFLDLVASAAVGHHAVEEVHRLRAEAVTAEQVLLAP